MHYVYHQNTLSHHSNRQDFPQYDHFNNRRKGLLIIQSLFLVATLGHRPGLKPFNMFIIFVLDFIHSFTSSDPFYRRQYNQFQSLVLFQGIDLLLHGLNPSIIILSLVLYTWFNFHWQCNIHMTLKDKCNQHCLQLSKDNWTN